MASGTGRAPVKEQSGGLIACLAPSIRACPWEISRGSSRPLVHRPVVGQIRPHAQKIGARF